MTTNSMNNSMKNIVGIISIILICHTFSFSQDVNTLFPEGFGINQLQTSENLSTGTLNISLPIESYLIPISIGYNTGGIKQAQRATTVGLGWNLNAGGFIQRQARGLADDEPNGYSGLNQRGSDVSKTATTTAFQHQIYERGENNYAGMWDAHPDLYFFQFAGKSGYFSIDDNRETVKLSQNNLDISVDFNSTDGFNSFTIIDESGNIYVFDVIETIKKYQDNNLKTEFNSKWHLSSVTNYTNDKSVVLTYIDAPLTSTTFGIGTYSVTDGQSHNNRPITSGLITNKSRKKLVKTISFEDSDITFNYTNNETSLPKRQLSSISYTKNEADLISYSFEYTTLADRLMLTGVKKSALDVYLYQFTYYGQLSWEPKLSHYGAPDKDHWGFKNRNTFDHGFPTKQANRYSDDDMAIANSLKRIYHTTGGYTEYKFEGNRSIDENGFVSEVGGLRIKEVYQGDHHNSIYLTKSYSYLTPEGACSGQLYDSPIYTRPFRASGTNYTSCSNQPINNIYNGLGQHINYEYVTVTTPDGGSVRTKFLTFEYDENNFSTGQNTDKRKDKFWFAGPDNDPYYTPNYGAYDPGVGGPFGYQSFKGSGVGQPKLVEAYNSDGNLVEKIEYFYSTKQSGSNLLGINSMVENYDGGTQYLHVDFYTLSLGYLVLDQIESTSYDANSSSKNLTMVTEFDYTSTHQLMKSKKSYKKNDDTHTNHETTEYLFQNAGTLVTDMNTANLYGLVTKKVFKNNDKTISTSVNTYGLNSSSKIELTGSKNYSGTVSSNKLSRDVSYDYNTSSKSLESTTDNITGNISGSLLNDSGTEVLASITNADISDCAFSSFENAEDTGNWENLIINETTTTDGLIGEKALLLTIATFKKSLVGNQDYLLSYWYKSGTVLLSGLSSNTLLYTRTLDGWTFEERLIRRSTNGDLQISGSGHIDHVTLKPKRAFSTTYTSHEVFGRTSETDNYNNTIFYEYDEVGRPTITKDKNLDVISSSDYHITQYAYTDPSLKLDFTNQEKQLFVISNKNWTLSSNRSWLTISGGSQSGIKEVELSVTQNNSTSDRTGILTLNYGSDTKEIEVKQTGTPSDDYLYSNPISMDVKSSGSTTVHVYCNKDWIAQVAQSSNCTLTVGGSSTTSGTGDGSFTISATQITPNTYTFGSILLRTSDSSHSILISINFDHNY